MLQPQFYSGAIDATGCISNAWNLIKPSYGLFLGISVLALVIISCIPCVNVFLMGPIMGGVYYVSLRAMRGEPIDFGMMFKGFEKFVPLMVVGLIQSIPSIIYQLFDISMRVTGQGLSTLGNSGQGNFYQSSEPNIALAGGLLVLIIVVSVVLMIFSIVWSISFVFAIPIMVENDISPIEAIKLSARAAWKNVGGIILLAILGFLIALGGMLVLCIGFLFVLPIIWVSWAFAYRQVFPALDQPKVSYEPPSPQSYGNFGEGI